MGVRKKMSYLPWFMELTTAFTLLIIEGIFQLILTILPIRRLIQMIMTQVRDRMNIKTDPTIEMDFVELVNHFGYRTEEHFVTTEDGYILGVHRILPKEKPKKDEDPIFFSPSLRGQFRGDRKRNAKGAVFLQHGFMQCSECWVLKKDALPFQLINAGWDVWLGNNRGNKYSYKHKKLSTTDEAFWNFCIDDYANYDVPAMIQHVLKISGFEKLSYVGFSNGTAQAFAAFSTNHALTANVNLFIALAPAAVVKHLSNQLVAAVVESKPIMIYKLFGKKSMLHQASFWRETLSTNYFTAIIDWSLKFLFDWSGDQIDPDDKGIFYSHLYSFSSVKCMVHWFQIIRAATFQAYDDNVLVSTKRRYRSYMLPSYHPSRITCPMAVFWGGKDTIPDMDWLLQQLPPNSFIHKEDEYEHLDFLWGRNAARDIFPKVIDLVERMRTQGSLPASSPSALPEK
eukprot:TRINITY_DN9152_c0_g1_i1.p1 TRINITY_DN9152_c0_g1~~TRINITY_DN9152_c0_g1_i1.p1  ORF type:complete len:455 (+),score=122.63 TRINITY_DN9152_c0_g1_i1:114-1478(+)